MRATSIRVGILLLTVTFFYSFKAGDETVSQGENDPPFLSRPTPWADSLIHTLSDRQKIAQLFMVAAYSNRDAHHEKELQKLVKDYGIGGLIYFQGGPLRQAAMCNRLQSASEVPMMIGMDAEWGLAMRLDSTVKYPWQMTLGAVQDDKLIFKMGAQIGEQMRRLGVHINFAPVVDINTNPNNPVINARSFGENREAVAKKGVAYMRGLQSQRVLANAKHFPGHGDTDKDSHATLPVIAHKRDRLDSVELYPFVELMESGLSSVMVAHLYIPAYVKEFNQPTTLAPEVVTGILRDSLTFEGLIITDALNMKGVSSRYKPGEVDLKALLAGNDVLLFSEDVPKAIHQIEEAVKDDELTMEAIEQHCLRILRAKEWAGLSTYRPIKLENLYEDLNKTEYYELNRALFRSAMTVIENKNELLPIRSLDTLKIAALSIGEIGSSSFHYYLSMYSKVDTFNTDFNPEPQLQKKLMDELEAYDLVIVSLHTSDKTPYNRTKIEGSTVDFLNVLRLKKKVVLTSFNNPYALSNIALLNHYDVVLAAYQNNEMVHELAAELIFGGIGANGRLPVTVSNSYRAGSGVDCSDPIRLNYVLPEEIGIDPSWLADIDSIVAEGLIEQAYPGCQVLAAKDGKVFYHRSFGYHTYDSTRQVGLFDIYDLASVTKVTATLLAIMDLDQRNVINLDYALCDYLPELVDTSAYAQLSLREILAHQAGLAPWIPFFKKTLYKGKPRYDVYSLDSSRLYSDRVADHMYINHTYRDSVFKQILETPLNANKEYRYSDIGYYFLKEIAEKYLEEPIEVYLNRTYYKPMGMNRTTFRPRLQVQLDEIIPTESDEAFRMQLIHGDVHDPGAAMLGGVGGHAGLFSNANDMAKLMQLFINGGEYGGQRYFTDTILGEYTSCQYCEDENRRGAGFDKPLPNHEEGGPTCSCVSFMSFGHSGFTGTYVWADPKDGIVYVFLSNRVYPRADNKKLVTLGIRTRIQEVIHDAVAKSMQPEASSVQHKQE